MKNKLTNIHPLVETADRYPNHPAIISKQETLTYLELLQKSRTVLHNLSQRGCQAGDIIVLDQLSQVETIISLWACCLGGFTAFPLNTRFPDTQLIALVQSITPALVVSQRELIPDLTTGFDGLLENSGEVNHGALSDFKPDTAVSLLMTSGSSGNSKLVQHTYLNHLASAQGSNLNLLLDTNKSWMLTLPLYHVGGLSILFRTLLAGAAVVIPESQKALLSCISDYQVTHISLVATQLQRLLEDFNSVEVLKGMDAILLGGSSMPPDLIQKALDSSLPIHVSYGSTEMASQITTTGSKKRSAALTNSGILLEGRDLIISHDGEILVKGETLASGYLEGSTLVDFRDQDGWFHTGDVGYVDIQGSLSITGRMDNQFISGGENIQPEHIEIALLKVPGIAQAIVLPQVDPEFGARPVAYIQLIKTDLNLENMVTELGKTLPKYMIPTDFFHLPEQFDSDRMKISRHELSEFVLDPNNHLHHLK